MLPLLVGALRVLVAVCLAVCWLIGAATIVLVSLIALGLLSSLGRHGIPDLGLAWLALTALLLSISRLGYLTIRWVGISQGMARG